ncbi:membrane protein insertase YidC [Lishizhenia sp.]|uniref:membrane protein insertase YidC n=1 Tax=Lishizhenia sp. TaxID=2497594 RepID=UPI00299D710B|nr:membrane protein insertase YidC [Lishizhenia sp.]MDX1445595.1 membrane protein insertase YidC [Lishizhenia sp.]
MDRNTIIGLGLIGGLLALYTYFNQPTEEEIRQAQVEAREQAIADSLAAIAPAEDTISLEEANTVAVANHLQPKMVMNADSAWVQATDSLNNPIYTDTLTQQDTVIVGGLSTTAATSEVENTSVWIENDRLKIELHTEGGRVANVLLKEFESYENFAKEDSVITALKLIDGEHSNNAVRFPYEGGVYSTADKAFEIVSQNDNNVTLRHSLGGNKAIEYIYALEDGKYDMTYEIRMYGLGEVTPQNVMLDWNAKLVKTERLLSEQRRISTVFFKEKNENYDYLSEASDDDQDEFENDIDWVAFKQSYFSSILMPANGFGKNGSDLKITTFGENSPFYDTHIKDYQAQLNLGMTSTDNGSVKMNWFFGPNDYELLSSYNNETEDIINLGWGIFRWVNVYAIQPLFNWFASFGINLGIAILLLTIVVKSVLTPIQWKMFTSSAKMRILKPEIEELNKKYPNKEDAMKKQMETMALYKETGSSPLAGCVPMLIQMPILFAVFRFFPSSFELRQKSFLWAEDLSSYDSIANLSFDIPFYGDHVSLFTLLMAATTLIYTILNSSNMQQPQQEGMPNMKYIMYFFPIMMIFFFNNYSSGLSYYYFISTLMSILTMVVIKNFFVDEEKLKAKMAAKKAENAGGGKKAKKSKFQERLEQMQKAQQEKMKK